MDDYGKEDVLTERRTLIQALEGLEKQYGLMCELAYMAEKLNDKLCRKEGMVKKEEGGVSEENPKHDKDIVQLFDLVAENMNSKINTITHDLNHAINMID